MSYSMFSGVVLTVLLAGCSHGDAQTKRGAEMQPVSVGEAPTVVLQSERERFIARTLEGLDRWESVFRSLEASSQTALQPLMGDLRSQVVALIQAPEYRWQEHRPHIEESLNLIRRQYAMERPTLLVQAE